MSASGVSQAIVSAAIIMPTHIEYRAWELCGVSCNRAWQATRTSIRKVTCSSRSAVLPTKFANVSSTHERCNSPPDPNNWLANTTPAEYVLCDLWPRPGSERSIQLDSSPDRKRDV